MVAWRTAYGLLHFLPQESGRGWRANVSQAVTNSQTINNGLGRNMTASQTFQVGSSVDMRAVSMSKGIWSCQFQSAILLSFTTSKKVENLQTGYSAFISSFLTATWAAHAPLRCVTSTKHQQHTYIPVGHKAFKHNTCPCDVAWKATAVQSQVSWLCSVYDIAVNELSVQCEQKQKKKN